MNKLKISIRVNKLNQSPIRKFFALVERAEKRGIKVFKLNIGDSDIETPKEILKGISSFKNKNIHYAPSSGIKEHIEAWIKYYRGFGIYLGAEEIISTVGVSEGILMTFLAISNPGDEVIVFEPLYANYQAIAAMCGVKLVPIRLKLENGFVLSSEKEIIRKITKKTRGIVVINPDNPTGKAWGKKELEIIAKVARKNNLYIIADETYREIIFRGKPLSMLLFKNIDDNLIVLDSISKRFLAPGIRLGVVVSKNKEFTAGILKIAMSRLSAPTIGQLATIQILKKSRPFTKKLTAEFKKRRDIVNNVLRKMKGVVTYLPNGAFYQVIKLPVKDSESFIKFMLEDFSYQRKTVLVSPMEDFYVSHGHGRDEIRIAYVLNVKELNMAMEVFKRGLQAYLCLKP